MLGASDRDGGLGVATMRRDRVDGEGGSVGFGRLLGMAVDRIYLFTGIGTGAYRFESWGRLGKV